MSNVTSDSEHLSFPAVAVDLEDESSSWFNTAHDLLKQCKGESNIADLNTAIYLLHCAAYRSFTARPKLVECLQYLARALLIRFSYQADIEDVQKALLIYSWSSGAFLNIADVFKNMDVVTEEDPNDMINLARSILMNICQAVDQENLQTVMTMYQEALKLQGGSNAQQWRILFEFSEALLMCYHATHDRNQVDQAISFLRKVHEIKANRSLWLCAALISGNNKAHLPEANRIMTRVINTQNDGIQLSLSATEFAAVSQLSVPEMDTAIATFRKAETLLLWKHPVYLKLLHSLGFLLYERFNVVGDARDVDEAIVLCTELLDLCAPTHADRGQYLIDAANFLRARFKQSRNLRDNEDAIKLDREALVLLGPSHEWYAGCMWNLALAITDHLEERTNARDINEVIKLYRELLTQPDFDHVVILNNLGKTLHMQYEQEGDPKYLDEAIQLFREQLALLGPSHAKRSKCLNNLGAVIGIRFEKKGDERDLDEAIQLHREALDLATTLHSYRGSSLNNLAAAVLMRYNQRGDSQDIDEAINLFRETLAVHSLPHPDHRSSLSNLSAAIVTRFKQIKNPEDINEGIELLRKALAFCAPSDPDRTMCVINLANAIRSRFQQIGRFEDLDEAIKLNREALTLLPPLNPNYNIPLNNLANALQARFEQRRNPTDIDEAIKLHRKALVLRAPPHPDYCQSLNNLGLSLALYTTNPVAINEAMTVFREASAYLYASPLKKLEAIFNWIIAATKHNHIASLEACRAAINLLPEIAAFHLDLNARQQILAKKQITQLTSVAVTCAIKQGQPDTALEFLEATRSIFWAQALRLRTPFDQLEASNPVLASKVRALSQELEKMSFRDSSRQFSGLQSKAISIEAEAARCSRLNEEWKQTIKSVQDLKLPGLEDFMKPKTMATLQKAAASGPIVVYISEPTKSFALIITLSKDVQCIELPQMVSMLAPYMAQIFEALGISGFDIKNLLQPGSRNMDSMEPESESRLEGHREQILKLTENETFGVLLSELWVKFVKPVFNHLGLKKSSHPPRLWWCPTGQFAFVPIHAAGIYDKGDTDCVANYVISSYTPSITALLNPPSHTPKSFKITAVAEPNAPGCSPLPSTWDELVKITNRVPSKWLTKLSNTTGSAVMQHLQDSSIMHFACHGVQDPNNSLNSGLMLTDGRLKISKIMQGQGNEDTNAKSISLAFLSACETAKGDQSTPDEAIHLAATFMYTGFHEIVATMWTIQDEDGPRVADVFYKHLFKNCDPNANPPVLPDLTKAAEALHMAVSELRAEPGISFRRWVPFIHYGL
ncbi:CHAT domain-containing protein [Mycena pura]|uniref:CHAT domain-containing protein n=1 Tax=Mycena pura TaxID=153505 RepID=A0AAD6VBF8_9AGAR|nr:CHAT domain-containing protein [Mycena pura]